MNKDLIRKAPKADETKSGLTEAQRATEALAEMMLFGAAKQPQRGQDQPRIIVALDCTTSMGEFLAERNITAEVARTMANALFAGRAELLVRLAYFRGHDQSSKQPRQLRFSKKWYDSPGELARAIAAIEHWPGWTQHCRLLRHVVEKTEKQGIQQVVIISDAFEQQTLLRPDGDDLMAARVHARRLRNLGVEVVVGFKGIIRGGCPLDRAGVNAEQAFRAIAAENGGYVFPFHPASVSERFTEIATRAMLLAKGDVGDAQALLEHLQAVPFEWTVGERVPSPKCQSQS